MDKPHQITPDIAVLPAHFPIPGMGFLPIHAFVIKAREPVLVDTGMGIDSDKFMEALGSIVDPKDLKWIWLTHDDADHTGNLQAVLKAAPNARLALNGLAALRISTWWAIPMDRLYWLNPGDSISAGDRTLTAVRPPLFDNPTAIGVYDPKSETFISVDCFGGLVPVPAVNVDEMEDDVLAQGMTGWATADSPWVHLVHPDLFARSLDTIRQMNPKTILSSHLPSAQGRTEAMLTLLAALPTARPFIGPNQIALEQILAQMKGGA